MGTSVDVVPPELAVATGSGVSSSSEPVPQAAASSASVATMPTRSIVNLFIRSSPPPLLNRLFTDYGSRSAGVNPSNTRVRSSAIDRCGRIMATYQDDLRGEEQLAGEPSVIVAELGAIRGQVAYRRHEPLDSRVEYGHIAFMRDDDCAAPKQG